MNFFSLFGLPEQFDVDLAALSRAYQTLAQVTHPDKFASGSSAQKLAAVQKNAQVNDGYQVLKKPLSRAEHMLELRGMTLQHEQQTMQDPEFLMQQMEWREQLSEIDQQDDPIGALESLDDEIAAEIRSDIEVLARALKPNEPQANQLAANQIRKLKFLEKLRAQIALKEEQLTD
jgi:molecular chaperone HscB